ncbi:MAG: hypothetical protein JNL67_01505 [Planctomycetaceae bacterium]|nr:hypothetical protein [Planctomycetaceae bacterium]
MNNSSLARLSSRRTSWLVAIVGFAFGSHVIFYTIGASLALQATQEATSVQDPMQEVTEPPVEQPTRSIRFNLFQRNQNPVLRAKRPSFQERDNERLYFSDFFAQALQGAPPDFESLAANSGNETSKPTGTASEPDKTPGSGPFDELISAETIEDLVKSQVNQLTVQITTPGRFRSDYNTVHQTYVQLALLFAVNEHYGKDIRWKDSAAKYRAMLGRTVGGTRVGTDQAYQLAVRTRDDLQQILRGERPEIEIPVEPLEDWSGLFYRAPLMQWLDSLAQEQMRPLVSDVNSTKANESEVLRQSEQIAAIAQLLLMPNMEDHDDDAYAKHALEMKAAALEIKAAFVRQDYADVGTAVNRITQACDACHGDFQ